VAREVQKQRPTQDVGFVLEGGIEAAQKRWDRALELYARGLKVAPDSTDLATRMHVALMASQQTAAADRHAAAWVRAHPDDAGFHFFLGDTALARQRLPEAETHYRNVLKVQPDNALALNNVAWLMATAKKPGAVEMARKATALLPNRPVILDTLAVALASEGQLPESGDVMKQAVALEQGNPHLRFNLAKLLAQAGNKAAARTELNTLAALGDKFPRQGEVAELLKTL
jgi:Flp pilus assembly protein TadD